MADDPMTPSPNPQPPQRPVADIACLIRAHSAALYRYAYRLTGSEPDAEDLTQQAFLVAQQKLGQLRDPEKASSWLYAIVRTCFLKGRRRPRPVPAASLEMEIERVPEAWPNEDDIDRERLQQALDSLPDEQRTVLMLFYYEDCSYKEIAAELEVPIGTVMSRLARAKERLRHALSDVSCSGGQRRVHASSAGQFSPNLLRGGWEASGAAQHPDR